MASLADDEALARRLQYEEQQQLIAAARQRYDQVKQQQQQQSNFQQQAQRIYLMSSPISPQAQLPTLVRPESSGALGRIGSPPVQTKHGDPTFQEQRDLELAREMARLDLESQSSAANVQQNQTPHHHRYQPPRSGYQPNTACGDLPTARVLQERLLSPRAPVQPLQYGHFDPTTTRSERGLNALKQLQERVTQPQELVKSPAARHTGYNESFENGSRSDSAFNPYKPMQQQTVSREQQKLHRSHESSAPSLSAHYEQEVELRSPSSRVPAILLQQQQRALAQQVHNKNGLANQQSIMKLPLSSVRDATLLETKTEQRSGSYVPVELIRQQQQILVHQRIPEPSTFDLAPFERETEPGFGSHVPALLLQQQILALQQNEKPSPETLRAESRSPISVNQPNESTALQLEQEDGASLPNAPDARSYVNTPKSGSPGNSTSSGFNASTGRMLNESHSSSIDIASHTSASVIESLEYARRLQEKALTAFGGETKVERNVSEKDYPNDFEVARRLQEEEDRQSMRSAEASRGIGSGSDEESLGDPIDLQLSKSLQEMESFQQQADERLARFMQTSGTSIRDLSQEQLNAFFAGSGNTLPEETPASPHQSGGLNSVMPTTALAMASGKNSQLTSRSRMIKGKANSFDQATFHNSLTASSAVVENSPLQSERSSSSNGKITNRPIPQSAPTTRRLLKSSDDNMTASMPKIDPLGGENVVLDFDVPVPKAALGDKKKSRKSRFGSGDLPLPPRGSRIIQSRIGAMCSIPKTIPPGATIPTAIPPPPGGSLSIPPPRAPISSTAGWKVSASNANSPMVGIETSPTGVKRSWLSPIKGKRRGVQPPQSAFSMPETESPVQPDGAGKIRIENMHINARNHLPSPITQRQIPSGTFVCAKCGVAGGSLIVALNRKYHVDCFRCQSCGERIDSSEPFAYNQDNNGEKHPYHRRCFAELFGISCVVCKQKIPASDDGTVSFVKHPFFDNEHMCLYHAENGNRRCTGCHRFEPQNEPFADLNDAGRCVCYACCRSVVVDNSDVKPLWSNVLTFLSKIKLPVWDEMWNIPILVVQSEALNNQMIAHNHAHFGSTQIMARGMCLTSHDNCRRFKLSTMKYEQGSSRFEAADEDMKGFTYFDVPKRGTTDQSSVFAILCLSGLPKDLTCGILAHEATHAWLRLHPENDASQPQLPAHVEEGCAQLVAMLLLNEGLDPPEPPSTSDESEGPSDERLRDFFKYKIQNDESSTFGVGFKRAAEVYNTIGIEALLSHVVRYRDFPST